MNNFKCKRFLISSVIILAGFVFFAGASQAFAANQLQDQAQTQLSSVFSPFISFAETAIKNFGFETALAITPDPDICGSENYGGCDGGHVPINGCCGGSPAPVIIDWVRAPVTGAGYCEAIDNNVIFDSDYYVITINGIDSYNIPFSQSLPDSSYIISPSGSLSGNTNYTWSVEAYYSSSAYCPTAGVVPSSYLIGWAPGVYPRPSGSFTTADCSPPDIPISVTASAAPSDCPAINININWQDNSTDETRFEIERSQDSVNWISFSVSANTTTYTDTGLNPGTLYYYRVRACNDNGCSDYSDPIVSATTVTPIDGAWSDWTDSSACTVPCGGGTKTQTRTYTPPFCGGADYSSLPSTQNIACNTQSCSCVDTTWSPDPDTVCLGQSFTQTSDNCPPKTQTAVGTNPNSPPCSAATPSYVIDPPSVSKQIGQTQQFIGWYDQDGPGGSDYGNQNVTNSAVWSSSNTAIGTVTDSGSKGLATCVSVGTATIYSTYNGFPNPPANATLICSAAGSYTLTVTKVGSGSGTAISTPVGISCGADCSETYNTGTSVNLQAFAFGGSTFAGWFGEGCSGIGNCIVSMTQERNVTVAFTSSSVYTLTVVKNGTGSGTVTSSPAGVNCGADCSETYNAGASVTLTASESGDSTFEGWSGEGCSGAGTCAVSMIQARNVTATFNLAPASDFTLNNSGNIYATVLKEQAGDSSATTITVIPYNGFSSNVSFPVGSIIVSPSLPAGSTFNFNPNNLPQSQYSSGSQFSVHIGSGLMASQLYTITVQGVQQGGDGLVRTNTVYLNVQVRNPEWIEF